MQIKIDIDKARFALIGDGYIKEEVLEMSDDQISTIWCDRFYKKIEDQFYRGIELNLYTYDEVKKN